MNVRRTCYYGKEDFMKKFVLFICVVLVISLFSFALATGEGTTYYYENDSGELIESDEYELDDDAVLLDDEEDLYNLYGGLEGRGNCTRR